MTNKEATNAARRIPFTPDWPDAHPALAHRIECIVERQVVRCANKAAKRWLQANNGQAAGAKAPGHDAAVKAGKPRKYEDYTVLGATEEQSWNNYEQDRRRRG